MCFCNEYYDFQIFKGTHKLVNPKVSCGSSININSRSLIGQCSLVNICSYSVFTAVRWWFLEAQSLESQSFS